LHHLERSAQNCPAKVGGRVPETTLEAIEPGANIAMLWNNRHLVFIVSYDLGKLLLDVLGALRFTSETGQDMCRLLEAALLDKVARGFGQEKETDGKDDGPKHLNSDRNAVRSSIVSVLSTVVDARGKQDTDGDAELIARDESTSDLLWGDL
jgi:hypothetical protein